MGKKKLLKLSSISEEEREVLKLLNEQGQCLYGNIFKQLLMPPTKGSDIILSLTSKGYIKNVGRSSYYELDVEIF